MIPVGEWLPDQAETLGNVTMAQNVYPRTINSYGPVQTLAGVGSALDGTCKGAKSYRGSNGTVGTFAGTTDKLYKWNGTDFDDVSKSGGYSTTDENKWDYAQFGDYVLATNFVDPIQYYQLGVSTLFADLSSLGDTPPTARFAETVRDFMFIGRTSDGENFVEWSGLNDISGWTSGTNQSDIQPLPTGGRVMGIVGGEYGVVFCETAIHRFTYTGDSTIIFQRDEISLDRGCAAEGSIAFFKDQIFFLANDGFWMMQGGQGLTPIGDQKIDSWFWSNVNQAYLYNISSTIDPLRKLYIMAFPSLNSVDGRPDTLLYFNWTIGRWSYALISCDVVASLFDNVGYTGDNFPDAVGAPSPDTPGVPSPDSAIYSGTPRGQLAGFGADNKMSFFLGPNMEAIVSTIEGEIDENSRQMVTQVWPKCDGGTLSISMGTRNRLNDGQNFTAYVTQNVVGFCPVRTNARYHQALMKIAANSNWSHVIGFNYKSMSTGWR